MSDSHPPYRLLAYNSARQSENKMHDDSVARQFGFLGGLVPGVDVYAYMAHPAVGRWRRAFLERGTLKHALSGRSTTANSPPLRRGRPMAGSTSR